MIEINELIRKAQLGDLVAWDSLLAQVYPLALRQARAMLRDPDLAGDAVQNALLKMHTHLHTLVEIEAFSAWWRRIVTNEVYMILRLKQRDTEGFNPGILQQIGVAVDELVVMRCELARVLRLLPFDQQQVVIDVDLLGVSLQEVAEGNQIPIGTVKSRLSRGRERLQHHLEVFREGRREKKKMEYSTVDSMASDLTTLFYSYLEGTMNGAERGRFELDLAKHPEWAKELRRHKDFLTLLHTLTGKMTLTSAEIMAKIRDVSAKITDYEQVVDDTYYEQGIPQTLTSHSWFQAPDLYRMESRHPSMGEMIVVVRGVEALSYMEDAKQAVKIKVSEEFKQQMGLDITDILKLMAAERNSRALGTEYVSGRPALHLQFNQQVSGKGDMITHLWMDKDTWMPLVTELYNAAHELVQRKVVRELRLNQGLPEELFNLPLPPDIEVQDNTQDILQPIEELTLHEVQERLGEHPYLWEQGEVSQAKYQWIKMPSGEGVLLTQYFVPGDPLPKLTLTQGKVAHANLPPQLPPTTVSFEFAGTEIEGLYLELGLKPAKGFLVWNYADRYFTAGGDFDLTELLSIIAKLSSASPLLPK
ncbi:sigma-70 family RNA polymerase sigma factor [Desulfosporosinus shakirovi]|uniref:sigma-70 family RNA polymerase sigma factor n=1 Tax=Desulfosporosinus shakirovi TaxID=2885154 RepID=UPI001E317B8F|nr:sigma-70 family RNA polymerase sigma factor [Desulfosporosinus sp. SRJS8]MCB8818548.1 sigma-70 family RNA polymerase sigma factor [Desulfosporosinus sp. SRJS8]